MLVCPYTKDCSCTIGKDCSTQVVANNLLSKSASNRAQAEIAIIVCQTKNNFDPKIKEE